MDLSKKQPLVLATPDELRSITQPGAATLTDAQAELLLGTLIDLGYTRFEQVPGPVWQRYISKVTIETPARS